MNRRDFGAWGLELNDDDFACALATAGVLLARHGNWPSLYQVDVRSDLAVAFGETDATVSVACSMPFQWFEHVQWLGAPTSLAQAWREATRVLDRGPRLALVPDAWPYWFLRYLEGPSYPWLLEQLSRPAVTAESVIVAMDEPEAEVSWAWPLRVGLLRDSASDQLRREIILGRRHPALTEIVTVPTPGVECDVLLVPFDLRGALLAVMQSSTPVRAGCVVVLGGQGSATEDVQLRVLSLRSEARTAGVAIAQVDAARQVEWFNAFLDEISHGAWIDVALARACRTQTAPPPFFVASQRLLESAHISVGAQALARQLAASDEEREISLGAMSPRTRRRFQVDPSAVSAPARHLRDRLAEILPNLELEHDGDDATAIVELARAHQAARSLTPQPVRHLQAQLFDTATPDAPRAALRAGAPHRIDVRIGTETTTWASLAEAFPDDRVPPRQSVHRLTVVLTDPRVVSEPQVETLLLPAEGNSETARFFVFAPAEGVDRMEARITVLHENRVLQTARLRAAIAPEPAEVPEADQLTLTPETFISLDLSDLGGRTPFDVALVLNHTGGEPQATAIAGEYASLIAMRNVEGFVSKIADRLSKVAWKENDYAALDGEATRRLFYFLATQGSLLYKAILAGTSGAVKTAIQQARRLQLIAAKEGDVLPVELAYTFTAPGAGATLCQQGFAALAERATRVGQDACGDEGCPAGCEKGTDKVVCPLGFWGLSRVIERQSDGLLPLGGTGADFGIRLTPGARRRLEILRSAVFAASSRVDKEVAGSSDVVHAALMETTHDHTLSADTWNAWVENVKTSPTLLALLVHTEMDNEAGAQLIEIGQRETLLVSQVEEKHVRGASTVQPVVLLVGCRTSLSDAEFQQFPVQFQRSGAALVLGTVATVLGRRAGPVMASLIRAIAEMTARGDVPFGEALLATKQKLVASGELMAMCLCAHGDADWILGAPRKEEPRC